MRFIYESASREACGGTALPEFSTTTRSAHEFDKAELLTASSPLTKGSLASSAVTGSQDQLPDLSKSSVTLKREINCNLVSEKGREGNSTATLSTHVSGDINVGDQGSDAAAAFLAGLKPAA